MIKYFNIPYFFNAFSFSVFTFPHKDSRSQMIRLAILHLTPPHLQQYENVFSKTKVAKSNKQK